MDDILPVHWRILLKEADTTKASNYRSPICAIHIVYHASFALETASVNVEEAYRIALLESLILAF